MCSIYILFHLIFEGRLPDGANATYHLPNGLTYLMGKVSGGCLHGKVRGFDEHSLKMTLVTNMDYGMEVGPTWYLSYSKFESGLVGILYQKNGPVSKEEINPPINFR